MEQQRTQNLTVQEAGAKGGATTYARYGRRHFQELGKRGQAVLSTKINSEQRQSWGALGGRPKKHRLFIGGEKG